LFISLSYSKFRNIGEIICLYITAELNLVSIIIFSLNINSMATSEKINQSNSDRFLINGRLQVVFDMETGDPDDFITLLFLLGHPLVHLKAVTIVPGTPDQIGFIRYTIGRFGRSDLPIGVFNIDAKPALSKFHLKIYADAIINESREALDGSDVLLSHCDEQTILICGGPLKNVAKAIQTGHFKLGRLVAQGGFAGDNIIPEEKRLTKFNGRITCPTFNLAADMKSAKIVLDYNGIKEKYFVSKNVCHGVVYTKETHKQLEKVKDKSQSLEEMYHVMSVYLNKSGKNGKAFHDPLTACCAIDLSIGQWKDVMLYMDDKTKEWGSMINENPNVKIIVDYDQEKFLATLFAYA
jgi:inosine-uridine nucleoside N-ribohydrolase